MAKFDFALEGVLRNRKHVESECLRILAGHQARFSEAEVALHELDRTMKASIEDLRQNRLTGRLDLGFLAAHRRYIAAVQRQGTTMIQRLALIQRDVDTARKALAEAAKQRKIMEKLREKQLERWKTEISRKEAAELDEVNMRMAAEHLVSQTSEASDANTVMPAH